MDRRDRDEASAVHRGMEVAGAMRAPQGLTHHFHIMFDILQRGAASIRSSKHYWGTGHVEEPVRLF